MHDADGDKKGTVCVKLNYLYSMSIFIYNGGTNYLDQTQSS